MKVLNLYCCIGGNRKLWPAECEVTAVELDPEIAAIYQEHYPHDRVIVADAHQYLLEHYQEYDFIWSSPPCQHNSRIRFMAAHRGDYNEVYPDLRLYEEYIFLKHHFKGKFVIENVIPYYKPLIAPTAIRTRHFFWANFVIPSKGSVNTAEQPIKEVSVNSSRFGFTLKGRKISKRKDQVLRDLVDPEIGLLIFKAAFQLRQEVLA